MGRNYARNGWEGFAFVAPASALFFAILFFCMAESKSFSYSILGYIFSSIFLLVCVWTVVFVVKVFREGKNED